MGYRPTQQGVPAPDGIAADALHPAIRSPLSGRVFRGASLFFTRGRRGGVGPTAGSKPGQAAKEHYAYSKQGSCCLLAAVEPLTGQRLYQVRGQRTKRAYTQFMQQLAAHYPQATKIRLVQDNLNTHALSTCYDCLPAAMAPQLAARFAVYYPPKGGSWLNQMELDFSALARQCLK